MWSLHYAKNVYLYSESFSPSPKYTSVIIHKLPFSISALEFKLLEQIENPLPKPFTIDSFALLVLLISFGSSVWIPFHKQVLFLFKKEEKNPFIWNVCHSFLFLKNKQTKKLFFPLSKLFIFLLQSSRLPCRCL